MDPAPAQMDPPAAVDPHASWKADADSPYPPRPVTRKGRVEAVETMMVDLTWEKGVTGPLLAAYWKLHPTTVADIAAEAWRNVQRDLNPDMVKKKLSNAFRRGVDRADLTGDVKGLASVGKAWADVAGITSSGTKVDVNILNDPAVSGILRVYRLVLDALAPGMSDIMAEAVKQWTAGGPAALKAFVEGQIQRMQLEAGDAAAITVEAGAPEEPLS